MIQIVGIILIMTACTTAGIYYANKPAFRIKDLKEIKKALIILHSEIEYTLTPLPVAIENISKRIDGHISKIFSDFVVLLKEKRNHDIGEIWLMSLEESKEKTYFMEEDLEYLISFGKTLGYLDKTLQVNSIALTIKYIEDKIEEITLVSLKNKKLYQTLGVLSGLLICIVLV